MSGGPCRGTVLVSLVVLLPRLAHAGAFEVAEQGASTGGMAHAGTAFADAESAWFNPAALTDDGGLRVAVGAAAALSRVQATSTSQVGEPWSARSNTPVGTPPYLYLSYARASWAASVAANVPFGGGIRWPDDWRGRYDALESKPQYFRVAGAFAYRLGPVALGAGFHADLGSLRIQKATDHISQDGHVTILLRGVGFGGDAYLLAHAGGHATIGASYKSRTQLPMTGEADFDVPNPFEGAYPDQQVSSHWTLPDRLAVAFGWNEPRWTVVGEVGMTLWSVNQTLALDFAEPVTADVVQQNHWRNTAVLRAGAFGRIGDHVILRAGAYVDGLSGAPPPAEFLSPSSPDATRLGFTAGGGFLLGRWVKIDVFAEPIVLLRRTSTSADAIEASYRGWAMAGGLGLTVGVPNRDRNKVMPVAPIVPEAPASVAPPSAPAPPPVLSGEVWGAQQAPAPAVPAPVSPSPDAPSPETPTPSPWDPPQ